MIKKIELLGIQIDNYTVQEAMRQVETFLTNTAMNTIEDISMEMLVKAQEDEALRESIEKLDLAVINEKEILKAAGVDSSQRVKETEEQQFFTEFMKRMERGGSTVCLFAATRQQLSQMEEFFRENYGSLKVLGSFALEECVGDVDGVVNEINVVSPDIIFSALPIPEQEYFLMEHKGKMNASIWYGMGSSFSSAHGVSYIRNLARRMMHKGMLKSMLSKYDRDK